MFMKVFRAFALTLFACGLVAAQSASLMPMARQQFFNANGQPLAGGLVYTYAAGTNSILASYTDATGTVANPNPVVLDAGGFASIWLGPAQYRIVVTDATGVGQWTADKVGGLATAGSLGNYLGSITAAGGFFGNLTGNVTAATITTGTLKVTASLTSPSFSGNLTGNVTGVVTGSLQGNVTGNVTGNLTGNVTGNAATATAFAAAPKNCSLGQSPSGVDANGNALNCAGAAAVPVASVEGAACTTTNASGATCTANLSWPTAFPDTNYHVACSLIGPIQGFPTLAGVTKSTSGVTVTIFNGTANLAQISTAAAIDCVAHGQ